MPRFASVLLAALLVASPALAAAPEPKKPIDLDRFMGPWYEILRTPNGMQRNCYAAHQVWSRAGPNKFAIPQYCHKDSVDGPESTVRSTAKLVDPAASTAKFQASFFGGLIKAEYWVFDHADDYSWMIAGTPNGKIVSLLGRKPTMPAAEVTALKGRIDAMGLDTAKLVAMGAK